MTPARFREIMAALNLSPRRLAETLGHRPEQGRYWNSGRRPVPDEVAVAVEAMMAARRVPTGQVGGVER